MSSEEKLKILEDPQEIIMLSQDLLQNCESQTIKTYSAQLLISLAENVDGMTTFIVDFCLQFLSTTLNLKTSNQPYVLEIIK